jgi:hypothetical protein
MVIDLAFENYKEGLQVKTRKGFLWTLENKDGGLFWRDETSKLIWFPEETGKYNHHDAMKLENEKKRLPTKEEFEEAEKHGIREILDMNGKWFWSASVHPAYSGNAYDFYGVNGGIYNFNRYNYYGSVRCVGR